VAGAIALVGLALVIYAVATGGIWEIGMGLIAIACLISTVALYRMQTRGRP
jgi:hypothetical protein